MLILAQTVQDSILNALKAVCGPGACGPASLTGIFGSIANTLLFLVGALSVTMIIIGALFYVTSQGNPTRIEQAKKTILYSIFGVVVAASAYAIVNFVAGSFNSK